MCFTISKLIQYKRKIDKQRVWLLAIYARLTVKTGFYRVKCMTISAVKPSLQSIYILWFFCLIFCSKISDKYQISISDVNQVIDITTTLVKSHRTHSSGWRCVRWSGCDRCSGRGSARRQTLAVRAAPCCAATACDLRACDVTNTNINMNAYRPAISQ